MANSSLLGAQVRFEEASPEQPVAGRQTFSVGNSAGVVFGVMAVRLPPGASVAEQEAAKRQLREDCQQREMVAGMRADITALVKAVLPRRGVGRCENQGGAGNQLGRGTLATKRRWDEQEGDADFGPDVYRLEKGYRAWRLVLRGKAEVIGDERAVELVNYLLKSRLEEAIHASVVENRVDGSPLIDGAGAVELGDDGEVNLGGVIEEATGRKLMGNITLPALKKLLAGHRQAMNDETLPQKERDEAERQLKVLLKACSSGGVVGEAARKAVARVRMAIWRLIEGLKAANRADGQPNATLREFGEHLEQYLWRPSMGAGGRAGASGRAGCFIYEPPPGVVWRG